MNSGLCFQPSKHGSGLLESRVAGYQNLNCPIPVYEAQFANNCTISAQHIKFWVHPPFSNLVLLPGPNFSGIFQCIYPKMVAFCFHVAPFESPTDSSAAQTFCRTF